MNAKQFFQKVVELREAQRRFFRFKTSKDLTLCKKLEREIDEEISRVKSLTRQEAGTKQMFLFDDSKDNEME